MAAGLALTLHCLHVQIQVVIFQMMTRTQRRVRYRYPIWKIVVNAVSRPEGRPGKREDEKGIDTCSLLSYPGSLHPA